MQVILLTTTILILIILQDLHSILTILYHLYDIILCPKPPSVPDGTTGSMAWHVTSLLIASSVLGMICTYTCMNMEAIDKGYKVAVVTSFGNVDYIWKCDLASHTAEISNKQGEMQTSEKE